MPREHSRNEALRLGSPGVALAIKDSMEGNRQYGRSLCDSEGCYALSRRQKSERCARWRKVPCSAVAWKMKGLRPPTRPWLSPAGKMAAIKYGHI